MRKFARNQKTKHLFHFFNTKPYLKDLIPDHHVDFHSHILPGIDDGAKSFESTLSLVMAMKDLRFEQLIATPHVMKNVWNNSAEKITAKLKETQVFIKENSIEIPLHAAAEYLMDGTFTETFQNSKLLTLKDNYVLVEMSYINPPIQLYDIIFDLQVAGYKPVLAHPERYLFFHNNFNDYEKLKHSGCLFQINMLSVVGYYGKEVALAAQKLLKKGLIDFAGSDIHHHNHIAGFSKKLLFKDALPLKEALANNQFFRL